MNPHNGGPHHGTASGCSGIPADLQAIRHELSLPVKKSSEIVRRIELCHQALKAVGKEEDAELWSSLHLELADSLAQNQQGSREENLEQAIMHYRRALEVYTRRTHPAWWAATQNNLGNTNRERIRGDRKENLEKAIKYHREALRVYTRQAFPELWAGIQHSLANAYCNRICGNRKANLEKAIAHANQALEVVTREACAEDWAATQNELASAYRQRICGERAENIEQAIMHYEQVLEVYTRPTYPEWWAMAQNNLANAYYRRIRGDRAENLEKAIACYQQGLEVLTLETYPKQWALTQHNLANAYCDRIRGERAENIERAITCQEQALEVRTRQACPEDWAMTQHTLGAAYYKRIRGERTENIEQAIMHYEQAIEVRTRQAHREDWAATQDNLANAYHQRILGERTENLERAIVHHQQALKVRTRQSYPHDWAISQNNLGNVYCERIHGDRSDNLERAIVHHQLALKVRTRQADPERWAMSQNNLGNVYRKRIRGNRAENAKQAILHYEQALTVRTLKAFPGDYQQTQCDLGDLYFGKNEWIRAVTAYQKAIHAEKVLLANAYTEPGRREETARTSSLYARAAYALLKLGRADAALAQLEQGKTRLMSQALALNEVDLSLLSCEQQETIRTLRQKIRSLESEMRLPVSTPARRDERMLAQALEQSRLRLDEAIQDARQTHPDFMPEGLNVADILALIPQDAVLVAPVVTLRGSAVFVVPAGAQAVTMDHVIWQEDFKAVDLQTILHGSAPLTRLGGWLGAYFSFRADSQLDLWKDTIETTAEVLWDRLMAAIVQRLAALHAKHVSLAPHGGLGLLPLHAAWHTANGVRRYFLDDYTISYVPSAYALRLSQKRVRDERGHVQTLFAIVNPTGDLRFARAEGEQVARLFGTTRSIVLLGEQATVGEVKKGAASYLHFACHGFYDWREPMQSNLILAKGEPFTLAQIIGHLNLDTTRLVTLSACETGITDIRQSPDEYLGLPAGFLYAGAAAIVSSLWSVDDLSTMLLMERFYQIHLQGEKDIPAALRLAQKWLRDVTAGELDQRFAGEDEALFERACMPLKNISTHFARLASRDPAHRPFAHPYYWAAFTFSGA
jgi:CHAT domain-containing protein/tetratricopeptide (TPR) repeat protein